MRNLTSKQLGDAAEHLVVAELGFAGTPAHKMPDNWPGYDVMAAHPTLGSQTISVKCRSEANKWAVPTYTLNDVFDWMAFVYVMNDGTRRTWLIPHDVCDKRFRVWNVKGEMVINCHANRIIRQFPEFEGNFTLSPAGKPNRFVAEEDETVMLGKVIGKGPQIPRRSELRGLDDDEAQKLLERLNTAAPTPLATNGEA